MVIYIILGISIVCLCLLYFYNRKSNSANYSSIEVDNLDVDTFVSWFKKADRIALLKSQTGIVAMGIKGGTEVLESLNLLNGEYLACLFNEDTDEVIEALIFKPKQISPKIADMFNDKDMVVFN